MNIVHIGTADNSGGAARASYALHRSLLDAGHDSRMLVGQKHAVDDPTTERVGYGRVATRLNLEAEYATGMQNLLAPWSGRFVKHPWVQKADVIHLHNLHGNFISHRILPWLSEIAPIVWTLHDQWPMTGHCAYTYTCERWMDHCGKCPSLGEYPGLRWDTTKMLLEIKDEVYSASNIEFVAPSAWMHAQAMASPLLSRFPIHYVPYGLDTEFWSPVDKQSARAYLGIGLEERVVLQVGRGARKGMVPEGPWRLIQLQGQDDVHMRAYYSAADVLAFPSRADNLPLVLIEAALCGLPAVAVHVGGVPDIVTDQETGLLVTHAEAMREGLVWLLEDPERRRQIGRRARELAVERFGMDRQRTRMEAVYSGVVNGEASMDEAEEGGAGCPHP